MQAYADYNHLISYDTSTVYRSGDIIIIRDYPTNTSKKHLRAWLDDYMECEKMDTINYALKTARAIHNEYIIILFDHFDDKRGIVYTFPDRHAMVNDFVYRIVLNKCTPTI